MNLQHNLSASRIIRKSKIGKIVAFIYINVTGKATTPYLDGGLYNYPVVLSCISYLHIFSFYEQVTEDYCQSADPQVQRVGL